MHSRGGGRGCGSAGRPTLDDAGRWSLALARDGDVVVTMGAGNVDERRPSSSAGSAAECRARALDFSSPGALPRPAPELSVAAKLYAWVTGARRSVTDSSPGDVPAGVEQDVPLARLTTVGIGGPARYFGRPETVDELERLLAWARESSLPLVRRRARVERARVRTPASTASSLRLSGELAAVEIDGTRLDGRRRRAERRQPAPGEGGGPRRDGVRMRDPGDGGRGRAHERRCLRPRLGGHRRAGARGRGGRSGVAVARRARPLVPPLVARAPARSSPAWSSGSRRAIRPRSGATSPELNARRKETQPINRRTFGSVFKNPDHELGAGPMLDACGLKGHTVGGARISPRHANFIENVDGGDGVRRAGAHGRSAAAGARAIRSRARARGGAARRPRAAACRGATRDRRPLPRGARRAQGARLAPGRRDRRGPRARRDRRGRLASGDGGSRRPCVPRRRQSARTVRPLG